MSEKYSNVTFQLEKAWVFGFKNLRVANNSENDSDYENIIYAIDFMSRDDETANLFITRFNQMISRLQTRFNVISSHIEFTESCFAIVEFSEK